MAASYPGSVKTFATRSAGQSIASAILNDLQDEVNAIEAGVLNGTAPLTCSNASVNALQVSGNSTVAGSLNVTGNSTFTGNVNFTGTVTGISATAAPTVRLSHSSTLALAAAAWAGLSWDTEVSDSTGMHSTASNSSRITFASSTGLYLVGASISISTAVGNADRRVRVMVNDSSVLTEVISFMGAASATVPFKVSLSAIVRAAAVTDFVTVQVFTDSTCSVLAESTGTALNFWATLVSA